MNKCIAFVDDDSKICRYFRDYAIYRGYACHCYHEAESALKGIVRNREGVWEVCVDLTLPGSPLQGPELITELRVRGVTAPIVIVTEDTSSTTQLESRGQCDQVHAGGRIHLALGRMGEGQPRDRQ